MAPSFRTLLVVSLLALSSATLPTVADEPQRTASPDEVLRGLRSFWRRTAEPDGSFRPGVDAAYLGMSDSALSDLAPVTYAVTLHKTFGWHLADEDRTRAWLLGRQQEDGAFVNRRGTGDPKAPLTRLYNTTQGLVALHALETRPKYDPLPVFAHILDGDYRKLPSYTTSFFPLAYRCLGRSFPPEQDVKIRPLLRQADDGYVHDHIASTFHAVHYYRLLDAPTPRTEALLARVLADQKSDGSWLLNPPARDRHATFDAVFCLVQLGGDRTDVKQALQRATAWALSCRNADGGFGHFPGSPSDADAVYFQVGILVQAGFLQPAKPLPRDPQLLSWGHLMPRPTER